MTNHLPSSVSTPSSLDEDVLEHGATEHDFSSSLLSDHHEDDHEDFDDDWNTEQQYRFTYPVLTFPQKMKVWTLNHVLKKKSPRIPSSQAVSDWLGYYNQLYQTSSPDLAMFKNLLSLHGMWDFKTPFKEGNTHFYNFHPECIFLADINYLLDRYIDKHLTPQVDQRIHKPASKQEVKPYIYPDQESEIEELFQKAQSRWLPLFAHRPTENPYLSVHDSVKLQSIRSGQKRNIWHTDAVLILEHLFLQDVSHWGFLSSYMHSDNRKLLCQMIHKETQNDDLLDIWFKHSWLSEKDVLSLRAL